MSITVDPHKLKSEAHNAAVKHLEENLEETMQLIADKQNDEDGISQGEVEPETLSHNTEDQDVVLAFQQKMISIKAQLKLISEFKNAEPTTVVDPGSLVFVKDQVFYVSTSVESFIQDGYKVTCISIEAPIYNAMKGLRTGDSFEYNGKSYTINKIV